MADENNITSASATGAARNTASDSAAEMKREIANLKRQVTRLTKQLTDQAEGAADAASGWYDSAAERASRATQALRSQAQSVSDVVRESPGTHGGALILGGVLGLVIGLMVGQQDSRRWWER